MATLNQKIKLFRGLLTRSIACNAPFYVTVDITSRCNLQCLCCLFHSPALNVTSGDDQAIKDIPYSLFEMLCNDLKIMGTRQIIICGEGEPFLHPRLFDLISTAKNKGFQVTLFTNGTLLDELRVKSLIDSGLDILKVSLWASSPDEYEKNYPKDNPANFKKVIDSLKLLAYFKREKKNNLPFVDLCYPINLYNFQSVDTLIDLAYTIGCNSLSFSPFYSRRRKFDLFDLSSVGKKSLHPSLSLMKKRLDALSIHHNINQTLLRYKVGEAVWGKLPCYIGWLHATIKMDGTVFPCCRCSLTMGNINKNRINEIWNDTAYRTFRRKTLSRSGLASLDTYCDCGFCGYMLDNMRVHRLFRWFSPFVCLSKL